VLVRASVKLGLALGEADGLSLGETDGLLVTGGLLGLLVGDSVTGDDATGD